MDHFWVKVLPPTMNLPSSVYSKWYWMATNNLYMQFGWPFTQPLLVSPSSVSCIFMCKVKAQGCKLFPDLRDLKCGSSGIWHSHSGMAPMCGLYPY